MNGARFLRCLTAAVAAFALSGLTTAADAAPARAAGMPTPKAMASSSARTTGKPISKVVGVRAPSNKVAGVCSLPVPGLAVSPDPLVLPTTTRDTRSVDTPFVIQNNGTGNLVVTGLFAQDPPCDCSTIFLVNDPNTCVGSTIPPGGSCTAYASFLADGQFGTGGVIEGSIDVYSNDPANPLLSVPVSGTVGAGLLTVATSYLDLGGTAAFTPVSTTLGITNTGTVPVTVGSISLFGTDSGLYTVVPELATCLSSTFGFQLAAGSSCNLIVTFTPLTVGIFPAAFLYVNFDDGVTFDSEFVQLAGAGTGSGGGFSFDPPSLNFFSLPRDQQSFTANITARNLDAGPLTVSAVSASPAPPFVADGSDCIAASPIPSGGTCLITLFADATGVAAGSYSGSLSLTSGAGTATMPLAVSVEPNLVWNPSSYTFPDTLVGSTQTFTYTLENYDPVSYSFSLIAPMSSFSVTGGTCLGGTVPASPGGGTPGTCTVDVLFAPASPGGYFDYVIAQETTTGSSIYGYIDGTGSLPGPKVVVTPSSVVFPLGSTGVPAQLALTASNIGTTATPTALDFLSDNNEVTVDPGTCTAVLAAGATCSFNVLYSRATVWSGYLGSVTIQSMETTPTFYDSAYVYGTTVAAIPATLEADPAGPVSFLPTVVNTDSAPVEISLGNTGTGITALEILSIVSDSPEFVVTHACPISTAQLAAQACCLVTVTFHPTSIGTRTGTLTVTTLAAGTVVISLQGQATAPSAASVVKAFAPASVQVGGVTTLTVSLSNANPFDLTSVAFTDTFPAGLVVAPAPAVTNTCGGTATATAGGTSLALTGGTIPAGSASPGACDVSVAVTGTAVSAGLVNTIPAGGVTSTETTAAGVTSALATASLVVSAAPVPGIVVNPPALSFPSQSVGTVSPPQTLTVTSAGSSPLTISGVSVTGDFSVSSPCTSLSPLAPTATCAIDVAFGPVVAGARTGQVVIASDDPATPSSVVTLAGTGVASPSPNVSLAPASLAFPTTAAMQVSAPLTSTLTNTGGSALAILAVDVIGSGFNVTNNCGASVAAGGNCTLTAVFAPPGAGSFAADVRITTNSPGSPSFLRLTGTATPAPVGRLVSAPVSLAFGDQLIGTTSLPQPFTISNVGSAVTSISGISVSGSDFSVEGTCYDLRPGESCAFRAAFTPTALGARSGQVVFTSDAANPAFGVSLSGTGVPLPAPRVSLSTSTLGFGNSTPGTVATLSVTVTNVGNADLVFGGFEVSGDFRIASACGAPLAPGQSCRIDVTFVPSIPGERTAELRILTNAEGSPHRVSLSGNGCRLVATGRSLALVCGR